ncbi:glutathione S-transferase family protein [Alsobacter sp. SYSU BS001988]|jgi:glutathione S-transferase
MLVIWGRISSVNVQKVAFAAGELGLAFERREAGGKFGVVQTPEYKAKNPNALVPTIEDDGVVLWESNAIVRYLAARYGQGSLWPQDPAERGLADRWMDWQQTSLNPAIGPAFMNLVRLPPDKRDAAAAEAALAKSETMLAILEAHLAGSPYLAGETITMAEMVVAPSVHRWLNLPAARQSRPHVEAWYAGLFAREAARQALPLPIE